MAEELIIRVKVDGMGGTEKSGSGSGDRIAGGVALGAVTGAALGSGRDFRGPYEGTLAPLGGSEGPDYAVRYRGRGWLSERKYEKLDYEAGGKGSYQGVLLAGGRRRGVGGGDLPDKTGINLTASGYIQEQETLFGFADRITTPARNHLQTNAGKYKALGSAMAYKVASSHIAIANHRSGDNYANQKRNNAVKFASYGVGVAMSGPLAPWVVAGMAVNEIGNIATAQSNRNYDRKLEGNQIKNIAAASGDLSYGRRRGGN